jgi:hypothetical protein
MSNDYDPTINQNVINMVPGQTSHKEDDPISLPGKATTKVSKPLGSFGVSPQKETNSVDLNILSEHKEAISIPENITPTSKEKVNIKSIKETSSKTSVEIDDSKSSSHKDAQEISQPNTIEVKEVIVLNSGVENSRKENQTIIESSSSSKKTDSAVTVPGNFLQKVSQTITNIFSPSAKTENTLVIKENASSKTETSLVITPDSTSKTETSLAIKEDTEKKTENVLSIKLDTEKKSEVPVNISEDTLAKTENNITINPDTLAKTENNITINPDTEKKSEASIIVIPDTEKKVETTVFTSEPYSKKEEVDIVPNPDTLLKTEVNIPVVLDAVEKNSTNPVAESVLNSSTKQTTSTADSSYVLNVDEKVKDGNYNFSSPNALPYKQTTTMGRAIVASVQENSDLSYSIDGNARPSSQEKIEGLVNTSSVGRADVMAVVDRGNDVKPVNSLTAAESVVDAKNAQADTTDFTYNPKSTLKKNDESHTTLDFSTLLPPSANTNISSLGIKNVPSGTVDSSINSKDVKTQDVVDFQYSNTPSDFATNIKSVRLTKLSDGTSVENNGSLDTTTTSAYVSASNAENTTTATQSNFKNYSYQDILTAFENRVNGVAQKSDQYDTDTNTIINSSASTNVVSDPKSGNATAIITTDLTRSNAVANVDLKVIKKYSSDSKTLDPKGFGFPDNSNAVQPFDLTDDGTVPNAVLDGKTYLKQENSDFGYVFNALDNTGSIVPVDNITNPDRLNNSKLNSDASDASTYKFPTLDTQPSVDQKYYYQKTTGSTLTTVSGLSGTRNPKISEAIDDTNPGANPSIPYSDKIEIPNTSDAVVSISGQGLDGTTETTNIKLDHIHNVIVASVLESEVTTVPLKSLDKNLDIKPVNPNTQKNSSYFVYDDFMKERKRTTSNKVEDTSKYDDRDPFTKIAGDWRLQDFTSVSGITNMVASRISTAIGKEKSFQGQGDEYKFEFANKENDAAAADAEANALTGVLTNGKIQFGVPVDTLEFPTVIADFMPITNSINTTGGIIAANVAIGLIEGAIDKIAVPMLTSALSQDIGSNVTINNALYNQLRREVLFTGTRFLVSDLIQNAVLYGGKPLNIDNSKGSPLPQSLQPYTSAVTGVQSLVESGLSKIETVAELGINETDDYVYKYGRLPGYIAKYLNLSAGQEFKNLDEYRTTIQQKMTSVQIPGTKISPLQILAPPNDADTYKALTTEAMLKKRIVPNNKVDKTGLKEADLSAYSQLLYPTDYHAYQADKNGNYDFANYNKYFNINLDRTDSYNVFNGIDDQKYSRFFNINEKYNYDKWSTAQQSLGADLNDIKKDIDKQRVIYSNSLQDNPPYLKPSDADNAAASRYPYPDTPDALKITFQTYTDDAANIWKNVSDSSNGTQLLFGEQIESTASFSTKSLFITDSFESANWKEDKTKPSLHQLYRDLFFRDSSAITITPASVVTDGIENQDSNFVIPDSNVSGKSLYLNEINKGVAEDSWSNPSSDNMTKTMFSQITNLNADGTMQNAPSVSYSNMNYVGFDYSNAADIKKLPFAEMLDVDYSVIDTTFQRDARDKSNIGGGNPNPYFGYSLKAEFMAKQSITTTLAQDLITQPIRQLNSVVDQILDTSATTEGSAFVFKDGQKRDTDTDDLKYLDTNGYIDLNDRNNSSGFIGLSVSDTPDQGKITQFSAKKYILNTFTSKYTTAVDTSAAMVDDFALNYGSYGVAIDSSMFRKKRVPTNASGGGTIENPVMTAKGTYAASIMTDDASTKASSYIPISSADVPYDHAVRYYDINNAFQATAENAIDVGKTISGDGKINYDVFLHYGKEGSKEDTSNVRNKYNDIFNKAKFYDSDVGQLFAYEVYNNANTTDNLAFAIPFQFNPEISGESRDASYVSISTIGRVNDFNIWSSTGSRSISFKTTYFVTGQPTDERKSANMIPSGKNEYYGWMQKWTDTYIQGILNYYRALMVPLTYDTGNTKNTSAPSPHPPIIMFKWNSFLSTKTSSGVWGKSNWIVKNLNIDPKYEYGYENQSKIPRGWDVTMSLVEVYKNWQSYQTVADLK